MSTDDQSGPGASRNSQPIFICYRQFDGLRYARWLYEALKDALTARHDSTLIYFDHTAPAASDWTAIHMPALQRASSFIVVITPGLFAELGKQDWVHREIDWWLQHRKGAPILIDATGEGDRWTPARIRSRWPNAQRVNVDRDLWPDVSEQERSRISSQIVEQILAGVSGSKFETVQQDLTKARRTNRWLKTLATSLAVLMTLTAILAWYFQAARREAQRATATARQQAQEAQIATAMARQQRQKALKILEWVVDETAHFDLDRADIASMPAESQRIIRGLIPQLVAVGFRGRVIIEANMGEVCAAPGSSEGSFRIAPDSLPIEKCEFWPSAEDALALGDRQASSVREFLSTIPHPAYIELAGISYGKEKPAATYPSQGTAGEWNRVARINNRIRISLEEDQRSFR